MDTCLSCYSKLFTHEQVFSYDQAELGQFHRDYQLLTAHWRAVLPASHFLEVDYEAVVDDLEREARRMLAFLGLPWDPACLAFHETQRVVRTASVNQVRKPVYRSATGRWRGARAASGTAAGSAGHRTGAAPPQNRISPETKWPFVEDRRMTPPTAPLQARVQALLAQDALEEAEALLRPLLASGRGPIPLWRLLAQALRRQGRITETRDIQQMLVDAVPGDLRGPLRSRRDAAAVGRVRTRLAGISVSLQPGAHHADRPQGAAPAMGREKPFRGAPC